MAKLRKEIRSQDHVYSEFYTRVFSKHFSLFFTKLFLKLGISANVVTYVMWATGILAALCFLFSEWHFRILGCCLLVLINILDTSDGEVARYLETCSKFGTILDKVVHFTTNQIIYFCIGYGLIIYNQDYKWLFLSFALIFVTTSDEILKELFAIQTKDFSDSAKDIKLKLSYNRKSIIQWLIHVLFGSTGLYHLFIIFVIMDIVLAGFIPHRFFFEIVYVVIFLCMNALKLAIRYKKVKIITERLQ